MPLFEYRCEKCGETIEHFVSSGKPPENIFCEDCKCKMNRMVSKSARTPEKWLV